MYIYTMQPSKKTTTMEKVIKNLETQLEELRLLIQKRKDNIDENLNTEQEYKFEDKTTDIEYQTNELEIIIENLKELK